MTTDHDAYPTDGVTKGQPEVGGGRLLVVVGYDGSDSARRALDGAPRLLAGRTGSIEVVFVAHTPLGAEMAPEAQAGMMQGFDSAELEFETDVFSRYASIEQPWHFHRRDGQVAHELIGVADYLADHYPDATIVIVVGSAIHAYHHVVGSVPVALVRHAKYPTVVVP